MSLLASNPLSRQFQTHPNAQLSTLTKNAKRRHICSFIHKNNETRNEPPRPTSLAQSFKLSGPTVLKDDSAPAVSQIMPWQIGSWSTPNTAVTDRLLQEPFSSQMWCSAPPIGKKSGLNSNVLVTRSVRRTNKQNNSKLRYHRKLVAVSTLKQRPGLGTRLRYHRKLAAASNSPATRFGNTITLPSQACGC